MKRIIDRIFSDAYANHKAIGNNFVLLIMYRFAYPFAVALNKFRLTPNQITTLSTAFALLAFVALIRDDGWVLFSICWGTSVLLDFCDGTVARMSNQVSKNAFRYDHMSDLFKIFLMFLGAAVRYDNSLVWIVSSSAFFLFMHFMILNDGLFYVRRCAQKMKASSGVGEVEKHNESVPLLNNRMRDRYRIVAWIAKHDGLYSLLLSLRKISWGLRAVLTTINGHSLLLFFLLPFGPKLSIGFFCYFGLLSLAGIRNRIATLIATQRP